MQLNLWLPFERLCLLKMPHHLMCLVRSHHQRNVCPCLDVASLCLWLLLMTVSIALLLILYYHVVAWCGLLRWWGKGSFELCVSTAVWCLRLIRFSSPAACLWREDSSLLLKCLRALIGVSHSPSILLALDVLPCNRVVLYFEWRGRNLFASVIEASYRRCILIKVTRCCRLSNAEETIQFVLLLVPIHVESSLRREKRALTE